MGVGSKAFDASDIMRRLRNLERGLRELTSGRRLESSSVGAGGIRVHSGGGIFVEDGGGVTVSDGGDVRIDGGSLIVVDPGGQQILEIGPEDIDPAKVGMRVRSDGVIRSENFDGDMTANDPGTVGWALGSDRLALLGAMVVPVDFYNEFSSGNNFSINSTPTVKTSITVPVPDWADEAGVIAVSMLSAQNNSASSDSLNGRSRIDGIEGQGFNKTVSVGDVFDVTLGQTEVLDVSAKSSFQADIQVWSGSNSWPADTANNAALSLLVVFRGTA